LRRGFLVGVKCLTLQLDATLLLWFRGSVAGFGGQDLVDPMREMRRLPMLRTKKELAAFPITPPFRCNGRGGIWVARGYMAELLNQRCTWWLGPFADLPT
jgi:hypothetical protein